MAAAFVLPAHDGVLRFLNLIPLGKGELMGDLSRIGVSIDSDLLERFDSFISAQGYENRSEAFRDLIRDRLVGSAIVSPTSLVVGTVTLIYDHHTRLLPEKLTDLQHESHEIIISTLHAHLDHENCLEVVVLRGKSRDVQRLADRLISTKGVQHGRLVMSSPEIVRHSHHHP
jgi:CopG family nickel-responsive transcriptional regulator